MTGKDKFLYILLCTITLGLYSLTKRKLNNEVSSKLSEEKKITINVDKLKKLLGGNDNVVGTEYSNTKVKIFFKKRDLVKVEEIRKLKGITGIVVGSAYITIIVGKQANTLSKQI